MKNKIELQGILQRTRQSEGENWKKLDFVVEVEREKSKTQQKDRIDCTAWNGVADEIFSNFLEGDEIYVSGQLRRDCWKDYTGNWIQKIYVNVSGYDKAKQVESYDESIKSLKNEEPVLAPQDENIEVPF